MYSHKMNKQQFQNKVEFSYYYQPKEFNISMRARVDANMMLVAIKQKGVNISNDFDAILEELPQKGGNLNDSIDWIKLSCYKKAQKQIAYSDLSRENKKQHLQELFNKYFKTTGNYMKTISLK